MGRCVRRHGGRGGTQRHCACGGAGAKYQWAGKTGTAQVVTVKQTESTKHVEADERKREHAWFIAFGPVDDPKIAVSVLVENAGFGATNAAPIARKVLDAYLLGPDAVAAPTKRGAPQERRLITRSRPVISTAVPPSPRSRPEIPDLRAPRLASRSAPADSVAPACRRTGYSPA